MIGCQFSDVKVEVQYQTHGYLTVIFETAAPFTASDGKLLKSVTPGAETTTCRTPETLLIVQLEQMDSGLVVGETTRVVGVADPTIEAKGASGAVYVEPVDADV